MKNIANLLSIILICILTLAPPLTDNFPFLLLPSSDTLSSSISMNNISASTTATTPKAPAVKTTPAFIETATITTPSLPALPEELSSLFPAHFTAHSIAASEEINGSLYTEELVRTHGAGAYNKPSYVGYFANICNCDFLCTSLTLNKQTSYFLDCDTLISLDLNDIVAAFPMHDVSLIPTEEHLADAAIKKALPTVSALLSLPDQNVNVTFSKQTPEDLTITCPKSGVSILTLNILDTPGVLTIQCQKNSTLLIRTNNTSFHKTLLIEGVPQNLIFLLTSDTFQTDQTLYGTILAPQTTITIDSAPFYGTILCKELISSAPLNGVTLSTTDISPSPNSNTNSNSNSETKTET